MKTYYNFTFHKKSSNLFVGEVLPRRFFIHAYLFRNLVRMGPLTRPSDTPVLDLLHAHRVSHKLLRNNMLNLFAIRTHFVPSVRKSALPQRGEGIITHLLRNLKNTDRIIFPPVFLLKYHILL